MRNGKKICEHLKLVRKQIADANGIPYEITECPHQGPCAGTCPKCESELRYIENQLSLRRAAGKAVSIVGLSLGISTAFMATGCTTSSNNSKEGEAPAEVVKDNESSKGQFFPPLVASSENSDIEELSDSDNILTGIISHKPTLDADGKEVYTIVDHYPEFPGGDEALINFIKENLRYPEIAGAIGLQGRVTVSFIIETDGSITNIEVTRSPAEVLSQEAIKIVKMMPKWNPGKMGGTPVRVKYLLPITFKIKE